MYYKGIVMKIKNNYAIVLSDDNEYRRIMLKNNLSVGQKIMYTNDDIVNNKQEWRMMTMIKKKSIAIVAALLLTVSGGSIGINKFINQKSLKNVAALVTVDINPSVKLFVDEDDKVVNAEGLNEDGQSLDLSSIIGIDVDEAVETVVSEARVGGFINSEDLIDDYVLVTMIPVEEDKKEVVEEIEELIQEKIVESDELQNVNIAMIEATMDQLEQAQDESIPVGLLAANVGVSDDEPMSVKEFFASKERIAEFLNTGEIIEQDLEKKMELVEKYLNELEAEGVNVESLQAAFELSKEDFFKAKELFELAKEEYKEALASGDEERIAAAKLAMEEAEKYKDSMEQNKDDVEWIKEQIKNQLEPLEDKEDSKEQQQVKEEAKSLKEQQKQEKEQSKEEAKSLREQQKQEKEQSKEEAKSSKEQQKQEEKQRKEEAKSLKEQQKREEEQRKEEAKRLKEQQKQEEKQRKEEAKSLKEQQKQEKKQ